MLDGPASAANRPSPTPMPNAPANTADDLHARIQRVIELMRPAVQSDGGDIEFVELTAERVVRIRLHGACVGCPSSSITLQHGIERNLKHHVPEVRGVTAVN